jgi:DNA adenine methylase
MTATIASLKNAPVKAAGHSSDRTEQSRLYEAIMIKSPFIYFGGKSNATGLIWSRFGTDCGNYIEPFFGSGAVLINRPMEYKGWMTANDLNGNLANFWRAIKKQPEQVAKFACNPVNEIDLCARHLWLVTQSEELSLRMMADPDFCDPKAAGWWCWGINCWIGSGWCDGSGPWGSVYQADGSKILAKTNDGMRVSKRIPHLGSNGKGVNRQLPHLGNGRGVNRQLPHLGNGQGVTGNRLEWLNEWFSAISERIQDVRVCCGDWKRIMSIGTMTRNGTCAVLLDPPYSQTKAVYACDSNTVAHDVREWCISNGANPMLRIALCGHDGEHNELEYLGWTVETWDKKYGYQGSDDRERIWFSPHCLRESQKQMELF